MSILEKIYRISEKTEFFKSLDFLFHKINISKRFCEKNKLRVKKLKIGTFKILKVPFSDNIFHFRN